MVPLINIKMIISVGLGCVLLPLAAFLVVRAKSKNITGALLAGVISFFVMQGIIRFSILKVLATKEWYFNFAQNNYFILVLIVAFSAAAFETAGRYLTMKLLMKDTVSYYGGISHGIGHGGIEMILLITVSYISYLAVALQINSGAFQTLIDSAKAAGAQGEIVVQQLEMTRDVLIATPAKEFAIAFVERFFTLFFQIGLSLMMAEGIVRRKVLPFTGIVLLLHTAVDTAGPMLMKLGVSVYIVEGVIGLFAAGMFIYTLTSKKRFEKANKLYPVEKEQKVLESDY